MQTGRAGLAAPEAVSSMGCLLKFNSIQLAKTWDLESKDIEDALASSGWHLIHILSWVKRFGQRIKTGQPCGQGFERQGCAHFSAEHPISWTRNSCILGTMAFPSFQEPSNLVCICGVARLNNFSTIHPPQCWVLQVGRIVGLPHHERKLADLGNASGARKPLQLHLQVFGNALSKAAE